ncbi:Uncharacterised protein [Cedecea neteri]|uniref:Uncharacterized protein n=1 Tax=Cedecea neteri TaxID=158822 RepID=A0A2X2V9P2_9ENTR|nr:Uncharacterised protein [Cedecea neteri]
MAVRVQLKQQEAVMGEENADADQSHQHQHQPRQVRLYPVHGKQRSPLFMPSLRPEPGFIGHIINTVEARCRKLSLQQHVCRHH